MIFKKEEKASIRFLAKCFKENKVFINRDWAIQEMGIDGEKYDFLIRIMEGEYVVRDVSTTSAGYATTFNISSNVLALERYLDLEEERARTPPDIMVSRRKR